MDKVKSLFSQLSSYIPVFKKNQILKFRIFLRKKKKLTWIHYQGRIQDLNEGVARLVYVPKMFELETKKNDVGKKKF